MRGERREVKGALGAVRLYCGAIVYDGDTRLNRAKAPLEESWTLVLAPILSNKGGTAEDAREGSDGYEIALTAICDSVTTFTRNRINGSTSSPVRSAVAGGDPARGAHSRDGFSWRTIALQAH